MQGKRPTRKQKMLIASKNLIDENWLVTRDMTYEMHIRHRYSDEVRVIQKERRV